MELGVAWLTAWYNSKAAAELANQPAPLEAAAARMALCRLTALASAFACCTHLQRAGGVPPGARVVPAAADELARCAEHHSQVTAYRECTGLQSPRRL